MIKTASSFHTKYEKMCNYYCLKIFCAFNCNISFMIRKEKISFYIVKSKFIVRIIIISVCLGSFLLCRCRVFLLNVLRVIVFIDCLASEVSRLYQTAIKAFWSFLALNSQVAMTASFLIHWLFPTTSWIIRRGKAVTFHHAWLVIIELNDEDDKRLVACQNDNFYRKTNLQFLVYPVVVTSLHFIDLLRNQLNVHRCVDSFAHLLPAFTLMEYKLIGRSSVRLGTLACRCVSITFQC